MENNCVNIRSEFIFDLIEIQVRFLKILFFSSAVNQILFVLFFVGEIQFSGFAVNFS